MPTESKKRKAVKEKKPIVVVKTEPNDIFALSHYADDKVELIRQIFGCLKSKTIQSVRPDFLQGKSLQELQEICLEEVLGISKKRLLSIINATKCPTDTESSDSESDVEKVEEHISLEEISSDSADEILNEQKKSKKTTKAATTSAQPTNTSANANNGTGKKAYSMLELLELQARARAIRSQLALEPVTKIELDDSDVENADDSLVIVPAPTPIEDAAGASRAQAAAVAPVKETEAAIKARPDIEELAETSPAEPAVRPIRLKRNFRKRATDDDEQKERSEPAVMDEATSANSTTVDGEKDESITNDEAVPESSKQRSPSPDIIPIIKEPEIFCISSGDESETDSGRNSYLKMPPVPKEDRPQTEDEIFLRKVKETALCKSVTGATNDTATCEPNLNGVNDKAATDEPRRVEDAEKIASGPTETQTDDQLASIVEPEPPEDGEIIDDDEPEGPVTIANLDDSSNSSHKSQSSRSSSSSSSGNASSRSSSSSRSNVDGAGENDATVNADNLAADNVSAVPVAGAADDEEDNDIIDLGKDEDLDFEMSTASESPPKKRKTDKDVDEPEPPADGDSWGTRWLRGRKVSTVLATSKLASKVRSKIKEKKAKLAEPKKEEPMETETPAVVELPVTVEVGSVEHYKELTKTVN